MLSTSSVISCNCSPLSFQSCIPVPHQRLGRASKTTLSKAQTKLSAVIQPYKYGIALKSLHTRPLLKISSRFLNTRDLNVQAVKREEPLGKELDGNTREQGGGLTTSILLFALWAALMYYVFNLSPNQTPSRDMYFLQKLLNLKGDDGFRMNEVLVSLWYIMGLWPVVYSMLLLPTGRSSNSKVPVWPFLVLSFFGGFYALLPYFVIWRPPSPVTEESELSTWPLNFLESKITAAVSLAGGVGLIVYATATANTGVWKEFYQYFRESRFIHVTCLDFSLLSAFSPFWVYNDMTCRRWFGKGYSSWLLPASVVPFIGPALYLLLRPSLPTTPAASPSSDEED